MSRIYFHENHKDGGAELYGAERHYMGGYVADLFIHALDLDDDTWMHWSSDSLSKEHPIRSIVTPGHYSLASYGQQFIRSIRTAIHLAQDNCLLYYGTPRRGIKASNLLEVDEKTDPKWNPVTISVWLSQLNTAMAVGSDPVKLMARLHGQCEIHCFVEGPNRKWLADIIEQGCESGLLRCGDDPRLDAGWFRVMDMLRKRDDRPVVCSYSVCEQFPNAAAANFPLPLDEYGDPDPDAWYKLPKKERWELAMAGIRKTGWLELKPENWANYRFGDSLDEAPTAWLLHDSAIMKQNDENARCKARIKKLDCGIENKNSGFSLGRGNV